MAKVQKGQTITSRIEAGNHVLAAAKTISTKASKGVATRLAAFGKAHAAYVKADAAVKKANDALATRLAKVAEADVIQDDAVEGLAVALVAEGLPRTNPFASFGVPAPSKLKVLGYAKEATTALALCASVRAKKTLTKRETLAALKALESAAKAVHAALVPVAGAEEARDAATATRNAIELGWETAFAALRRGADAASDDGFTGYDVLFGSAKPKVRPAQKKPIPTPP